MTLECRGDCDDGSCPWQPKCRPPDRSEIVAESTRLAAEQLLTLYPHLPPLVMHFLKTVSRMQTTRMEYKVQTTWRRK